MNEITPAILTQFKDRMKLDDEDANLTRILKSSYQALNEMCGAYTFENERFKELVFERARYVYNDALEFFAQNFRTEINSLALQSAIQEMSEADATV